jgi:hypothetical protein
MLASGSPPGMVALQGMRPRLRRLFQPVQPVLHPAMTLPGHQSLNQFAPPAWREREVSAKLYPAGRRIHWRAAYEIQTANP